MERTHPTPLIRPLPALPSTGEGIVVGAPGLVDQVVLFEREPV